MKLDDNPAFPFRDKADRSDDWQTPPYALAPLLPHLRKDWLIWEPCAGKGNIVKELRDKGFQVYGSDIKNKRDFLKAPRGKLADEYGFVLRACHAIVTNPPYSLKLEFLERAYAIGKPFAFLMPLFTFEGPKRQGLFREHGIEVIMMDRRIEFEPPPNANPVNFAAAWFTWGLRIGQQMTFAELPKLPRSPRRK